MFRGTTRLQTIWKLAGVGGRGRDLLVQERPPLNLRAAKGKAMLSYGLNYAGYRHHGCLSAADVSSWILAHTGSRFSFAIRYQTLIMGSRYSQTRACDRPYCSDHLRLSTCFTIGVLGLLSSADLQIWFRHCDGKISSATSLN